MQEKTRDVVRCEDCQAVIEQSNKNCARCKKVIKKNDPHFAGIPDVGDLCNPCHETWSEERNQ